MHRHSRKRLIPPACTLSSLWLIACQREQSTAPVQTPLAERRGADEGNGRIPGRLQHLVVIYLENRSFDNLYGEFAGADGLSNAAPRRPRTTRCATTSFMQRSAAHS